MRRPVMVTPFASLVVALLATACKFPYPADVVDEDAMPVDARVPVVTNFQAADLVVGPPDFVSDGSGIVGAQQAGSSIAVSVTEFWAATTNRAVRFSPLPNANQPSANLVLGVTDFTGYVDPTTVNSREFRSPGGIAVGGTKLVISDPTRNRVLVWDGSLAANGAPAYFALGQRDFASSLAGNGPAQLNGPTDVWTDGVRLMVADSGNHRVLVWYRFPAGGEAPADLVLGQPEFGLGGPPALPSSSRMREPAGVYCDGESIYVADMRHNRVLIWSTLPTANGTPATVVVGQTDFTAEAEGTSADKLHQPTSVVVNRGAMFVLDAQNNRIQVYDPIPTSNGARATEVLGQAAPDEVVFDRPISASSLFFPTGLATVNRSLFVADALRGRVLRFTLKR